MTKSNALRWGRMQASTKRLLGAVVLLTVSYSNYVSAQAPCAQETWDELDTATTPCTQGGGGKFFDKKIDPAKYRKCRVTNWRDTNENCDMATIPATQTTTTYVATAASGCGKEVSSSSAAITIQSAAMTSCYS